MSATRGARSVQEASAAWDQMQSELAALSTQRRHVIAYESGHSVYSSEPERVHDALPDMIGRVRGMR